MKNSKYKIAFLSLLVLVICTGVFLIVKKSFAYGEDVIYTRDELSEKVEELSKRGHFIKLMKEFPTVPTWTINEYNPLSDFAVTTTDNDTDLYEVITSGVKVKKTGYYEVNLKVDLSHRVIVNGGRTIVSVTKNNEAHSTIRVNPLYAGVVEHVDDTIVLATNENDVIGSAVFPILGDILNFRVMLCIKYLGTW